MDGITEFPFLVGTSGLLAVSFLFALIAVVTSGWSDTQPLAFLEEYNNATTDRKRELLWLVGVVVLIILGILCICFTAVIVIGRFLGHSKGRAKLGGFLSIFSSVVFIIALAIFMTQNPPQTSTYGYSFGLLWTSVPLSMGAGVIMMLLPDSGFLDSEVTTMARDYRK